MNYNILVFIQALSCVFAFSKGDVLSAQRDKSSPDWVEALDDFKNLVHVITFGEEIPSHHSNPLQILAQESTYAVKKNPFDLPDGWFGKDKKKNKTNKRKKLNKKPKSKKSSKKSKKFTKSKSKKQAVSFSQLQNQQSLDDIALLNFLVQLEEPNTRSVVQMPKNEKHLSSLIMAENRYNEIKKKLSIPKALSKKPSLSTKSKTSGKPLLKTDPKNNGKKKQETRKGKKWFENIDAKGAKNTLTLSVAFGVIVTALFCVVVQLFKLFATQKSNGSAFDQINRRSTHGYDRIALDVEDDDTAQP